MTKITIEVKSCQQCPHFKSENVPTRDSFDRPEKWTCTKQNQVISGYVDWYDKVPIPTWCPIKTK
jgi:hypothetical protein